MSPLRSRLSRLTRRALTSSVVLSVSTILLIWLYFYRDALGPVSSLSPLPHSGTGAPAGEGKAKPDIMTLSVSTPAVDTSTATESTKPSPGVASAPAATLTQGIYVGATLAESERFPKSIEVFRGVPFAQNTGGSNRFRPPVPLPPSSRIFDATSFGQICPAAWLPGGKGTSGDIVRGEDCLNANIYRPAKTVVLDRRYDSSRKERGRSNRGQLLPVVVYVHGGGFNLGSGSERNMASFVSWAKEPIIGVSFNYRVGALGFLPSAVTAREGVLNLGLRDQQMLLDWVRDNIKAFGGDPDNVTVMGLSAGAHSVGHHIMYYGQPSAPPAPFAKAILESGATTARSTYYPTHPRHLIQFREFLVECDLEGVPEEELFPRLRKLPLDTILNASRAIWDKYEKETTWPFQPVIDGPNSLANSSHEGHPYRFVSSSGGVVKNATLVPIAAKALPLIPDLPISSWRRGHFLKIPVLTGYNSNEGALFVPSQAQTNEDFHAFFKTLIPGISQDDLDELDRLYPDPVSSPRSPYVKVPSKKGKQWARLEAAYGHYAYVCPVLQTAHFLSIAGAAAGPQGSPVSQERTPVDSDEQHKGSRPSASSTPSLAQNLANVYVYNFAATSNNGAANHGDQTPVVIHNTDVLSKFSGLLAVSEAMNGAWVRFAASEMGTPNVGSEVNYDDDKEQFKSKASRDIEWPAFVSPFRADETLGASIHEPVAKQGEENKIPDSTTGASSGFSRRNTRPHKRWWWFGGSEAEESGDGKNKRGKLLVFGAGNNERMSKSNKKKGTPSKIKALSQNEVELCQFWWSKVGLSEGIGSRTWDKDISHKAKL